MSLSLFRICRDCNRTALENSAYCETHQLDNRATRQDLERQRRNRSDRLGRLYDTAQWRKRTSQRILARDPICTIAVVCDGHQPSTDVDHIIRADIYVARHGGDARYFYDERNLRGACHACHAHKTRLEQRGAWKENPSLP